MTKKTLFFPLILAAAVLVGCASPSPTAPSADFQAEHNARVSLDWVGTYRGTLPCADCEGIETTVVLRSHGGYHLQTRYIGKGGQVHNQTGSFSWNAAGNTVTLPGPPAEHYFVSEGELIRLAPDGNRISGQLADLYRLKKLD